MKKVDINTKFKLTNIVFLGLIIFVIISVIFSTIAGNRNEQKWLQESKKFESAKNLINNKQFNEAEKLLTQLLEQDKYKNSYPVVLTYGICQAALSNYEQAYQYFIQAQELRPLAIFDYHFNAQMGELLYRLGKYEEARKHLRLAQRLDNKGPFAGFITDILGEIEELTKP